MKLNGARDFSKYISSPKGRLPTEDAGDNKQSFLEFWRITHITIYIMKLNGARDFGKYISSPKGVFLLKKQEITSN